MNREDLRNVLRDMNEGYKEMKAEFEDKTDYVLDTSGTNCPLPIIKTKKELNHMNQKKRNTIFSKKRLDTHSKNFVY